MTAACRILPAYPLRLTICAAIVVAIGALADRHIYPEFAEWLSREREP